MTPEQFIKKWKAAELKERSAAQEHFIDICRMLGEETPAEADPKGEWYCFERGATKTTGGEGWADVWKRGHFGWEYKGKRKDLDTAFAQLQQYAVALENPPLLVVCDLDRFKIHTNWTNTVSEIHEFTLDELADAANLEKLKWVMSAPDRLKPRLTRDALTAAAAAKFADFAAALGGRGHDPLKVAHFVNRLVFCMFAEDVNLLPNEMFTRMLEHAFVHPGEFEDLAGDLFRAMKDGGRVGFEKVEHFNGGLFDDAEAIPLTRDEIGLVLAAARMNWAEIDPSIFGTLFERGLDPAKRSQLGAHYTDREKIMRIVEPVVLRPLEREWADTKETVSALMAKAAGAKSASTKTKAVNEANKAYRAYLDRLRNFVVLDPACGSGNFLYLSLLALKDLEHKVGLDAETLGLAREFPRIGPEAVKGIEINPYAAELARVTCWIGEIQWMRRNGFSVGRRPILRNLENIENRDALLTVDGRATDWPGANVVVGNPPFLGNKKMLRLLGDETVADIRSAYRDTLRGACDLVCYWFEKARRLLMEGQIERAGLVATKTIQSKTNREVLRRIADGLKMYDVWSNEEWVVDGAQVRVSLICFTRPDDQWVSSTSHDGAVVTSINSDLTAIAGGDGLDLTHAKALNENKGVAFQGIIKTGAFDIPSELARQWLTTSGNPNGRPNSDVLRPFLNGTELTKRPPDRWVIDFGVGMTEIQASMYEKPFEYAEEKIKAKRAGKREASASARWWLHQRPRPEMRNALDGLARYIVTPRVSRHRVFVWVPAAVLPDSRLVAFARDDDVTFGILQSRFHGLWAVRKGMKHGVGNDPQYTPTEGFQTFPFPTGLTPDIAADSYAGDPRAKKIAQAARELDQMRRNWLYPGDLVETVPEVVPGYPDRIVAKSPDKLAEIRKRTLANLYGSAPTWLGKLHAALDEAVAEAYGWPKDISDDEALAKLLQLNLSRAGGVPAPEANEDTVEDEIEEEMA